MLPGMSQKGLVLIRGMLHCWMRIMTIIHRRLKQVREHMPGFFQGKSWWWVETKQGAFLSYKHPIKSKQDSRMDALTRSAPYPCGCERARFLRAMMDLACGAEDQNWPVDLPPACISPVRLTELHWPHGASCTGLCLWMSPDSLLSQHICILLPSAVPTPALG